MSFENRIQPLSIGGAQPVREVLPGPPGVRESPRVNGPAFGETLSNAINELDRLQVVADQEMDKVAMGEGNLHEMAIATEKANVSMRLAVKIRNKVVDAYQQVMRMGS